MDYVVLGQTKIKTNKNGFGVLPIQRVDFETAKTILRKAYDNGITFFDTARGYTDSEEKIGYALSDVRENIIIATKTPSTTVEGFNEDLETSLRLLKTDYIDIYQFHNPSFCPKPNDGTGLYEAMLKAKEEGKIRHIGITNHRHHVAKEAVLSGLYETLQFPFSYLASQTEMDLVKLCKEKNVGFICMKALSGGLITKSDVAYAYLNEFDSVLPIWGIQRETELDEFLSYQEKAPEYTEEMKRYVESEIENLSGDFCRGCGYCMPCPVGIEIPTCARMSLLLRRSPNKGLVSDEGKEKMLTIEKCINCNACMKKCPYSLQIPTLLKKNLEDFKEYTNM